MSDDRPRLREIPVGALVELSCGCRVRRGAAWTLVDLVRVVRVSSAPGCTWTTDAHATRARACRVTLIDATPAPMPAEAMQAPDHGAMPPTPRPEEPAPAPSDGQRSLF